jgi:uncharacterized damage-inducible protein DinB
MNELAQALIGESAHAAPAHILEALPEDLAHQTISGCPRTIYEELWHMAFWQQMTLDWVSGIKTPYPASPSDPFPTKADLAAETWAQLCQRFLDDAQRAAAITGDAGRLPIEVHCPSRPGEPERIMSVQDQLTSLAAHNAYHFGRIVLMRQMLGSWPPPSGGFTWQEIRL